MESSRRGSRASFRARTPSLIHGRTAATLRLIACVAAVAIAARPTVAAPQQTDDGFQVITIGGQSCKCGPFYLCDDSNTINVPAGYVMAPVTDPGSLRGGAGGGVFSM